jgi:hypothetical protein
LFVTAHFAAHMHKVQARNNDFHCIDSQLLPLMCPGIQGTSAWLPTCLSLLHRTHTLASTALAARLQLLHRHNQSTFFVTQKQSFRCHGISRLTPYRPCTLAHQPCGIRSFYYHDKFCSIHKLPVRLSKLDEEKNWATPELLTYCFTLAQKSQGSTLLSSAKR